LRINSWTVQRGHPRTQASACPVGIAADETPPIQLGVGLVDGPGWREAALGHGTVVTALQHADVYDALDGSAGLRGRRSPALLQLLGHASAAQRAAGVSGLVP
jgi:hypothetical protein